MRIITLSGKLVGEGTILVSSQLRVQLSNWAELCKHLGSLRGSQGYWQLLQNSRGAYYFLKFFPKR